MSAPDSRRGHAAGWAHDPHCFPSRPGRGAKMGANTDRSRAVSAVVRRLSCQVSATLGDGERRLAWFGFAS